MSGFGSGVRRSLWTPQEVLKDSPLLQRQAQDPWPVRPWRVWSSLCFSLWPFCLFFIKTSLPSHFLPFLQYSWLFLLIYVVSFYCLNPFYIVPLPVYLVDTEWTNSWTFKLGALGGSCTTLLVYAKHCVCLCKRRFPGRMTASNTSWLSHLQHRIEGTQSVFGRAFQVCYFCIL